MRALAWAALFLLLIHLLATAGFVGWLYSSGRVDHQRVMRVVHLFRPTIQEEKRRQQEAAKIAAQAQERVRKAARLEAVADGPRTLQDRLAVEQQGDQLAMHRLERLHEETQDLQDQIERAKEKLTKEKTDLDAQRKAFDAFVKARTQKMQDEDFQLAVSMYEQLQPQQAKLMFEQLLGQGKMKEVVDYLAAMQLRKAAGVLKQFKSASEIAQAAQLIEKLRQRGVYPGPLTAPPTAPPAMTQAKAP